MDYTLNSLLTRSQNKEIHVVIIDKNNQNRRYQLLKIKINQLLKCQRLSNKQEQSLVLNQFCLKKQNKSPQVRQKYTQERSTKQVLSMPQQLHQKFIQQKKKELVQFLSICLTIISLIVILVEYHYLKRQRRHYDC